MARPRPAAPDPATRPRGTAGVGQVRIIGGQWRSRIVRFPVALGLRPTPDRVRETLFNWLGQDLTGLTCLDLFAGSGALSFEALSRHAREAVLVERDPKVRAALAQSAAALGAGAHARISGADALQFLQGKEGRFDLIFLDPPYGQGWMERLWPGIGDLAAPGALIYIESETAFTPPEPWRTWKSGKAGAVHYQLARREEHDE